MIVADARDQGVTVLSTARQERKRQRLLDAGAHHVLVDGGSIEDQCFGSEEE